MSNVTNSVPDSNPPVKFSKAQLKLLDRLQRGPADRWSVGWNAQTAIWLVKRGYAYPLGFTGTGYSSIEITDEGLELLKELRS